MTSNKRLFSPRQLPMLSFGKKLELSVASASNQDGPVLTSGKSLQLTFDALVSFDLE
jgi:hypothetical protein